MDAKRVRQSIMLFSDYDNTQRLQQKSENQAFSQPRRSVQRIDKIQMSSLIRRSRIDLDSDYKIKEEIWYQKERDIRKCFSKRPIQKRKTIDSLALLFILILLYVLALYFAPNQFYEPIKKK